MVGIKVLKKGNGTLYTVHALVDEHRTACGRKPEDMNVVERLDGLDKIPQLNGCQGCIRTLDGWEYPEFEKAGQARYLHNGAAPGRSRAVGPLNHGTRITRGNRLGGG